MQKKKDNIIDIVKSVFNYKLLKSIIFLYFTVLFSVIVFNSIKVEATQPNGVWFTYIFIIIFAFYLYFTYFLMTDASKKFLAYAILCAYFIVNVLFLPIPFEVKMLIISIASLLLFLLHTIFVKRGKMTNNRHKNFIKKLSYYIIMLSCNFFIASLWGMMSIFMYPFKRNCNAEYYTCQEAGNIELYFFSIISFLVVFALLIIANNIVFKNVKNIWVRAFAFTLFYILPVYNYIINR